MYGHIILNTRNQVFSQDNVLYSISYGIELSAAEIDPAQMIMPLWE